MILGSRLWLRILDYTLLLSLEFWLWTLILTTQAVFWPEELTKLLRFSIRMMNRFVFRIKIWFGLKYLYEKSRENAIDKNQPVIFFGNLTDIFLAIFWKNISILDSRDDIDRYSPWTTNALLVFKALVFFACMQ